MMTHRAICAHRRKSSGQLNVKVCSSCGVSNDDDAIFCVACNYFLEWEEEKPAARTPQVPPTPPAASTSVAPVPAAPVIAPPVPAAPPAPTAPAAQPAPARAA